VVFPSLSIVGRAGFEPAKACASWFHVSRNFLRAWTISLPYPPTGERRYSGI